MSRKTITALILFIAIPLLIYFFYPTDSSRIRKLIKRGVAATEQKDLKEVMSCISLNYRDDYGMTYLSLKQSFKRFFTMYDTLDVDYEGVVITVDDRKAVVELDIWVIVYSKTDAGYLVGTAADPEHFIFTLEKDTIAWRIIKTEGIATIYL